MADALTTALVQIALGALGGAAGTLAALRTRFAMIARDITDEMKARQALEDRIDKRLTVMDRRQFAQLRISASIARKVGVDERFDDALVSMLTEEPIE